MANKNNSRSPKGRFLTLQFRLIVNSTILETKKNKKKNFYCICGQQRPRSAYADLGLCYSHMQKEILVSDILKLYNIKMNNEAPSQIARIRNLIKPSVTVDYFLRIDLNFPT